MANRWRVKLIRPKDKIEASVRKAWGLALGDLQRWMSKELVRALTFGGHGIQGIAQTDFYRFISSPDGLSQLGIGPTEPPRLLQAYEKNAFKVSKSRSTLLFKFGDLAQLKLATPHPANGTGNLQLESWLEWIVDKKTVESGFVPRSDIPGGVQKNIRLGQPLGGLMLPQGAFGSTGKWRFPSEHMNYDVKWLAENLRTIEKVIFDQAIRFLQDRLR